MVTGFITIKKGYYYAILNLKDPNGKRKPKWIATKLKVNGNNKRKAEEVLFNLCNEYSLSMKPADMLFSDYIQSGLDSIKTTIAMTTFASYENVIKNNIAPYFKQLNISIGELTSEHIQKYYDTQLLRGVSPNTVIR